MSSIDIAKNFLERLAFFGRLGGERSQNRARLVVRRDPQRSYMFAENLQSNRPVRCNCLRNSSGEVSPSGCRSFIVVSNRPRESRATEHD